MELLEPLARRCKEPAVAGGVRFYDPTLSLGSMARLAGRVLNRVHMKTNHRSLLRLLSAAVVALAGAGAAHAQTVNPLPAPTIITSAPYTISAPGYYQLGADLNSSQTSGNIIEIAASNVTLDFAGHYISGPTSTPNQQTVGVYATNRANLKIQNGTIANCRQGINLSGPNSSATNFLNARILNMVVTRCYQTGIGLLYATSPEVNGCLVSNIGGTTTAANADGVGISTDGNNGGKVLNCSVSNISAVGSGTAYAIYNPGFAKNNYLSRAGIGIIYGKYQDNLTLNVTTPFLNGTDAGGNN